ncbi:unnamed protein product, partial [Phaeothamnion confervicola]
MTQLERQGRRDRAEIHRLVDELTDMQRRMTAQLGRERELEQRAENAEGHCRREQTLHQGRDASLNLEYLKNVVVRYLQTSEASEHARLLPVIATILQLSSDERGRIQAHIRGR